MTTAATARSSRTVPRAEPVGSLLRSAAIQEAIERLYEDRTTAVRPFVLHEKPDAVRTLNDAADREIARLVQRQIDAGLDVVTDGEVRRPIFLSSFYDAVEGLGEAAKRFEVRDDAGDVVYSGYADPVVRRRLAKVSGPAAEEATFMRVLTDFPFKLTFPAPSYFLLPQFVGLEGSGYASRQELLEDVVEIERLLVAEAIAAGARWIQFDFPAYPALVDADTAGSLLETLGESAESLLDRAIAADAHVTDGIPADVTVALHLCRGNFEGGFWSGSVAPIAERLFNELPHGRFLFEWEDVSREGDYSPIRHVPKGKVMVMGLVSTKTPELETDDDVLRRLDEAGRHLDVGQVGLSPQCGFASLYGDHLVSAEDAQWRKLELVGRVAERVWGRD